MGQRWVPWQKIDLNINAEHASPVFAFNRLFIFWAEFTKLTKSVEWRLGEAILSRFHPIDLYWRFLVPQLLDQLTKNKIDAALKSELSEGEIRKLEERSWVIDYEGYLFSNKTDARVQVNVDIYKPVLKFSYLNFGQTWVQPQVYRELDRELREHEYLRHEWQRVYVQRLKELRESSGQATAPEKEKNASVLEVDEHTSIAERLRLDDTENLTWAFWVNFDNKATPQRNRDDVDVRAVTLFNHDDRLDLTATNQVTEIAGIAEARKAIAAAEAAKKKTDDAAGAARAAAVDDRNDQAAVNAAGAADQAAGDAERAAQAASSRPSVANKVKQVVAAARQAAQAARNAASAGAGTSEVGSAIVNATTAEASAKTALAEARNAFEGLDKWESSGIVLTLKLDKKTAAVTLGFGWQHVAVTMSHGSGSYAVTIYKGGSTAGQTSVRASALSGYGNLHIGLLESNQADAFSVQLSDFRLWRRVLSSANLKKTWKDRQTGLETGLLYYLPLNEVLPSALMRLAQSDLTFDIPHAPVAPVRELQSERIVVFYGDEVGSMRSDLSEERDVQVSVDRKRSADVVNYDLDLSLSKLHVALTNGISLNDYAAGDESTLSRCSPGAWRNMLTPVQQPEQQQTPLVRPCERVDTGHPG